MRRRTSTLLAAAACAALASAALAQDDPPCARGGLAAQLMTPVAGDLPREGGLVVGLFPTSGEGGGMPSALSLTRGRTVVALRSEPIAPGLFRVVPQDASRLSGRYALSGLGGTPELYFRRTPMPAPPTAPGLERAERYLVATGEGRRLEVRAHFAFPIPENVVAIVSYWGDDPRPDAFVRAAPTQRSIVLYATSTEGECAPRPEGTTAPPETGGSVRVAFVDRHGQLSALSSPTSIE